MPVKLSREYSGKVTLSARPEQLFFSDKGLPGIISISTFLGDFVEYEITLANGEMLQLNEYTKDTDELRPDGQEVFVSFSPTQVSIYAADSGEVLSC